MPGSGAHATPFMHPGFARAWLDAVGGAEVYRPFFLDALNTNGQRVLWLFVARHGGWRDGMVRECVPIGSAIQPFGSQSQLAGYFEPIIFAPMSTGSLLAPGFWEAFVSALRKREADWFDICSIARFRTQIIGAPDGVEPYTAAPFLQLDAHADIDGYVASRRPKVRSSIRRRLRRIEEQGTVKLKVHDPADTEGICAWLPRLAAERERRHGARSLPGDFTRRLIIRMQRCRLVHCSTLELDGRAISWKLGYLHDRAYYGYYRAFDPAFYTLAPGQVHFYLLLRQLMADGVGILDFGIGTQDYKYEWTDGAEWTMGSLQLESRAPASVARRSMASTVRQMRRLSRSLPLRDPVSEPQPEPAPVSGGQD